MMETYHGYIRSTLDAIVLFEACRLGLLPRVQRRLSDRERRAIRSGSIFVWDEGEAGMRRWTDGKSWSASRVSGSFLTYREMEGKRAEGGSDNSDDERALDDDKSLSDGYRYKPDGLMKQSFSITTTTNLKLHLISYSSRSDSISTGLVLPSQDPAFKSLVIPQGLYPDHTFTSIPPSGGIPTVGFPSPYAQPQLAYSYPTMTYDHAANGAAAAAAAAYMAVPQHGHYLNNPSIHHHQMITTTESHPSTVSTSALTHCGPTTYSTTAYTSQRVDTKSLRQYTLPAPSGTPIAKEVLPLGTKPWGEDVRAIGALDKSLKI